VQGCFAAAAADRSSYAKNCRLASILQDVGLLPQLLLLQLRDLLVRKLHVLQ
jgi:hypothetical protein